MDLNETAAFVAVIRAGSFTKGALALGVPKSTVSRQVKRLEERLGVRLIHRTTRRLTLTEAGQAYFDRCANAVERIEEAESIVHDVAEAPRGTLRIATPPAMHALWELFDLSGFLRTYPDIALDIHESQRAVDLVGEGFDVALRGGVMGDSTHIARQLAPSAIYLVAAPSYLEEHGEPKDLTELSEHTLLVFRPGPRLGSFPFVGPHGVEHWRPESRVAVNDFRLLRDLAVAGHGIAMCEPLQAVTELEAGKLVRVLPDYALEGGAFWLVYPSSELVPPKARVFIDHITRVAKETMLPLMETALGVSQP